MKVNFTLKFCAIALIMALMGTSSISQTTITIQPGAADGKDAILWNLEPNQGHGDFPDFAAIAGTNGGTPSYTRALIEFDLSVIPSGATVTSAFLSLYSYDSPFNGHHNTINGSNACELKRITSSWDENSVSWNTEPATTNQNMVILPASTASIQDYPNINVTLLVQDMIADPNNSFGFLLKLVTEQHYRAMIFASSDNTDPNLHPKLEITYVIMNPADTCITLRPDSGTGKDAQLWDLDPDGNRGDHPDFAAIAGTNGGTPSHARGLIDFDLSVIPSGATITSALLSLYSYDSPNNGHHITIDGSNACELKRITSSWDEHTVTWNTEPSTTNQNMVILPQSTASIQDYPNINVTFLVQDMIADPNNSFGFLLKLVTEQHYRAMIFASSDNADPNLHPKLEICYNKNTSIKEDNLGIINFNLYPNPAEDIIYIELGYIICAEFEILNITGQTLLIKQINKNSDVIDISGFANGIYFLQVRCKDGMSVKKFAKQ